MENSNECEQNNDDLPLEYFHRWRKRGQKSKIIYMRVRPEEKETILIACNKAGLSIINRGTYVWQPYTLASSHEISPSQFKSAKNDCQFM